MLKTKQGTSQIDHVVISLYGIFVIETKTYQGWIHGREYSEYWTQTIYKKRSQFKNPIKQNWAHICALKETLIDYQSIPYYSIIVFAGGAELKNVNSKTDVIYLSMICDAILKYRGAPKLSVGDRQRVLDILTGATIEDKKARREHIQQVKQIARTRKVKELLLECPKCGGSLVNRSGPYGDFFGCSNYPHCKYKRKI